MTFSSKAEYGVRLMVELGRQEGDQPTSLKAIAEAENLPPSYLEHVVASLKRAGLVACSHEGDAASTCSTKLLWMRVQSGIIRALQGTTLAELVEFSRCGEPAL